MLEWFRRTTERLDTLLVWTGAFGLLWFGMSWLGKSLSLFGNLPWPEAIFLGLAVALATALVTTASLALWRVYVRPRADPPSPDLPELDHDSNAPATYDELMSAVETAIAARLGQLQFPTVAETIEAVDARAGHMVELNQKRFDKIEKEHGLLDAKVSRMVDDYQRMLAFKAEAEDELKDLKAQTEQARESFAALQCRDAMRTLAPRIEEYAAELYDPLRTGEVYDDERWKQWERVFGSWEAMLIVWIQNAQWYAYKVSERIYTVDHSKFGGDWSVSDDQFPPNYPRSLAVHHFKKFRIMHTQWEEVRKEAESGVDQVAYVGMSPKEMQRRPRND